MVKASITTHRKTFRRWVEVMYDNPNGKMMIKRAMYALLISVWSGYGF
jgi:hypothetical protein